MKQPCPLRLPVFLPALLLLVPAGAQAQPKFWELQGSVDRNCAISYDCGGNDRCNELRLSDRTNMQEIAEISVSCNFAGQGVSLELSSQNGGALRAGRDPLPLEYDISLSGMAGGDFSDRSLSVPLRVPVRIAAAAQSQTGLLRIRLYERRETLAADRYSDRIVVTVLPDPS